MGLGYTGSRSPSGAIQHNVELPIQLVLSNAVERYDPLRRVGLRGPWISSDVGVALEVQLGDEVRKTGFRNLEMDVLRTVLVPVEVGTGQDGLEGVQPFLVAEQGCAQQEVLRGIIDRSSVGLPYLDLHAWYRRFAVVGQCRSADEEAGAGFAGLGHLRGVR
jgi:hypothetical protein